MDALIIGKALFSVHLLRIDQKLNNIIFTFREYS